MSRIPQFEGEAQLRAPYFSEAPSGLGVRQGEMLITAGAERLGEGLQSLAISSKVANERRQAEIDSRWVNDTYSREHLELSKFMSSPENYSKEDFPEKLLEFAQGRASAYQEGAPTRRAFDALTGHVQSLVGRKYEAALAIADRVRLDNGIRSVDGQVANALESFRELRDANPGLAAADMQDSMEVIGRYIDTLFAKSAPETAQRLREHLAIEVVSGTLSTHPGFAKMVLDTTKDISERKKLVLYSEVEQAIKSGNTLARDEFDRTRKDWVTAVEAGNFGDKIPLSEYQKHYEGDRAAIEKRSDDEWIDTFNEANKEYAYISHKEANHQLAELKRLSEGTMTVMRARVLKIVADKVEKNIKLQENDRVSWMLEFNPDVAIVNNELSQTTNPEQRAALLTRRTAATLKYQGMPPKGDLHPDWYLGRPTHDRKVMTVGEAEEGANYINNGAANEAIGKIDEVIGRYGKDYSMLALNDMATLPEGKRVRQEYQLAFLNRDAWWVDSYVSALGNAKPLTAIDDTKKKIIEDNIDNSPIWKQFQQSMMGDNFARAREISGFKDGVTTFSHALISAGKTPKEAVRLSIERLLSTNLGFTKVNGQPLAIYRKRDDPKAAPRTDEEIDSIGSRLAFALNYIDPREVKSDRFAFLGMLGKDQQMPALRDTIQKRGFFQVEPDGQGASLHILDDNGLSMPVLDKNGRQFVIRFDDLPSFMEQVEYFDLVPGTGMPGVRRTREQRVTLPPLITTERKFDASFYEASQSYPMDVPPGISVKTTTNWPSPVNWLLRKTYEEHK